MFELNLASPPKPSRYTASEETLKKPIQSVMNRQVSRAKTVYPDYPGHDTSHVRLQYSRCLTAPAEVWRISPIRVSWCFHVSEVVIAGCFPWISWVRFQLRPSNSVFLPAAEGDSDPRRGRGLIRSWQRGKFTGYETHLQQTSWDLSVWVPKMVPFSRVEKVSIP